MLSILEVKNTNLSLIMDDSEDSTEQNEKDNPEQEDFEQQEKILPNSNFMIRFDSSDMTHQFINLSINNHLIHLEYSTPPPEILS